MSKLFSQRFGYTSIDDVIIRDEMPESIQNAICNWYDMIPDETIYYNGEYISLKKELNIYLWTNYLNRRTHVYECQMRMGQATDVFVAYIYDAQKPWYCKLDVLEIALSFIEYAYNKYHMGYMKNPKEYIKKLNDDFARLNYAYRIVDNQIVDIIAENEIMSIESAIENNDGAIKKHLSNAIELYAKRPNGDYRNSIKEAISAVEKWCRDKTSEKDLRNALNKLSKKGIVIHKKLHSTFNLLYEYTNHEETGIRHALMDDEEVYTPTKDEAIYMIVACSAFINYLNSKISQI